MKNIKLLVSLIAAFVTFLGFGVNSLANVHGDPALATETVSEPINILLIGFGLIALGSFLKRGSGRDG